MITREEQHELLLADLTRAMKADLVFQLLDISQHHTYYLKSTVDMTTPKRTLLEEYLHDTYPDVDVTVSRKGRYIRFMKI